jgi:CPA2 family monovalent cation:H+ antiporter-2
MHQTVLIEDLAIILCVAAVVTVLFQKIKQPIVLGYLIAGLIVGPYTPPFSLIDDEFEIRILAELGVIFLMFSIGLEFTFGKLKRLGIPAIIIGVIEVVLMMIVGFYVGQFLGWSTYENILLGAALAISSTTIIIKALEEYDLKRHKFAELMIGVLLVEDLLAILLLVYVSTTGASDDSIFSYEIGITSIKLLLVISSWFLIGYLAIPFIMRKIQDYINHETLTIISIGLCLFLSVVASYFEYSQALGAFIMGMILAETPLAQKIEELTLPIRDIFAAVFFVSVGMLIDPVKLFSYWPLVLGLSLITIVGKMLTSGLGSLVAGQTVPDSIRVGFSMAQIGEFSFIIMGLGSSIRVTDETLYPLIVAISAVTTFTTPYLIKIGMNISNKVDDWIPSSYKKQLKRYQNFIQKQETIHAPTQKIWKTKNIMRFVINGVVLAIIAAASWNLFNRNELAFLHNSRWIEGGFWVIVSLLSTPFIWAMLFAHQPSQIRKEVAVRIITWLITFVELSLIAFYVIQDPRIILTIAVVLLVCFNFGFKAIRNCYAWLEKNLINNLTRRHEIDDELLKRLAPWDNELVRVKVLPQFPFIGASLKESQLRPSFGINIVAIKRNVTTIWLPNADERILPSDELFILGEKDAIDNFRSFSKKIDKETISQDAPDVETIEIDAESELIDKPISSEYVRSRLQGLIVGLDRKGEHILNPSPSMTLQEGDKLYLIKRK